VDTKSRPSVGLGYTAGVIPSPGHRRSQRPEPAYFCSLDVENVRCFGDKQRLNLMNGDRPAKWTVVLGDNGVGKTTLLQCLYSMAPGVHHQESKDLAFPRGVWSEFAPVRHGEQLGTIETRVALIGRLTEEGFTFAEGDLFFDERGPTSSGAFSAIEAPVLCCGYGASRRLGAGSLEAQAGSDAGDSLFVPDVPLINAVEWLLQADYASRGARGERALRRRERIERALVRLLPDVSTIRVAGLDDDPPRPHVEAETPYGWVDLRDLSLGYQTMIAWIVDLASRMFEAYPDTEDPLAEAAIVLVDEVDLHLHPRWQRRITSHLGELFPNAQFIVTAHSPLVVQAPGVTNIAVLRREGDQVRILNDPEEVRGWRVDQILTSDLFGLDSARPVDVERLMTRQQELVLLDTPSFEEQAELRKLDEELAKLAPGETARDREAWSVVHRLAERLRDVAGGET
jgi:hypothetical protein